MLRSILLAMFLVATCSLVLGACSDDAPADTTQPDVEEDVVDEDVGDDTDEASARPKAGEVQADHVTTRFVLLGYEGTPLQGARVNRSREDALELADEIKKKVEAGASMIDLVIAHSDDPDRGWSQGVRKIRNYGVAKGDVENERTRGDHPPFADVAFKLAPGEVGILDETLGLFVILREE